MAFLFPSGYIFSFHDLKYVCLWDFPLKTKVCDKHLMSQILSQSKIRNNLGPLIEGYAVINGKVTKYKHTENKQRVGSKIRNDFSPLRALTECLTNASWNTCSKLGIGLPIHSSTPFGSSPNHTLYSKTFFHLSDSQMWVLS